MPKRKIPITITHPEIALEWHLTKNGDLKPDKVSKGQKLKCWWQCSKGHEWFADVRKRCLKNKSHGCHYCCNQKVCLDNCLATTHPELLKRWCYSKNIHISPFEITAGSSRVKIWWQCEKGHFYERSALNEVIYSHCLYCIGQKVCLDNCLATIYPEIAAEWNYEKNNGKTPYEITRGSDFKAWWICKKGHEWQARVANRTSLGRGCPKCKLSKGEEKIKSILEVNNIRYEPEKKFDTCKNELRLRFDFYLPDYNVLIEYNGKQHYILTRYNTGEKENLELIQKRDQIKVDWAVENGIKLIVIPYWHFDKIEDIILENIN